MASASLSFIRYSHTPKSSLKKPLKRIGSWGDCYTVEVTRAGVTERYSGELVLADGEWLRLLEPAKPRNSGIKKPNRLFQMVSRKNVSIRQERLVQLVPADAAQIVEHQPRDGKVSEEQPPQLPEVGDTVAIQYAVRGKLATTRDELTNISADRWAVTEKSGVATKRSIPVLGELPLVGGMFTHTVFSMKTIDVAIPAANVISVQVRGSSRFEQPSPENAPE